MRKLILALAVLCLGVFSSIAQKNGDERPGNQKGQNSFFAEGGGPGIVFSANIDRRFKPGHLGFGARAGVGFVTAWDDEYDPVSGAWTDWEQKTAITFPVQLNYIFGKSSSPHTFEVGAGATYITRKLEIMDFYDEKETKLFGTFSFMYRRQPVNGGFSWRIGFTPLLGEGLIQAFGGVSVGYNF
ncbi:MAG TPA: hypothetical protein VFX58_18040 [Chitinophagaceae bacterium]|nr:hypothetical protein [Chitinophagaceae bacterium]